MTAQIVVSFRLNHASVLARTSRTYLDRVRGLCARAEVLGATIVAWGSQGFSLAWGPESIEEAIELATGLSDEKQADEEAWSCGIAEGEIETFEPASKRAVLAWGPALVVATSLAKIARPGEILADPDMRAVRVGELSTIAARDASDAGKRVRGWAIDTKNPWRRASSAKLTAVRIPLDEPDDGFVDDEIIARGPLDSQDVLDMVEAVPISVGPMSRRSLEPAMMAEPPSAEDVSAEERALPQVIASAADIMALKLARARVDAEPPAIRCHASLALAVGLAAAGRVDESLIETMDALARAHEAGDARGKRASLALFSKIFKAVGEQDGARTLLELAKSASSGAI